MIADQKDFFTSFNIRVQTPDGTMFVNIMEDANGKPAQIITTLGKAGSPVAAWVAALDAMITKLFSVGTPLEAVMNELQGLTSDRGPRLGSDGSPARSGPEGIWKALSLYRRGKFDDLKRSLGERPRYNSGPMVSP